ncbi:hypothetical protein [Fluviicola sp.]|uniref:hypothetical protein n=1 Tax=Fluviicola sp. TaxID=1917219 RepID=UPI0031CF06BD
MGTLNEVYQLKPIVLSASAILKVKKNCEDSFLKSFDLTNTVAKEKGIFSDTFLYIADEGKVERLAIYSPERIIDFKETGMYLSIQSDGKWGFNDAFVEGVENAAPFLNDALFFVIYDDRISRFEISNGKLNLEVTYGFDKWDYAFDKYILSNYSDSPQIIADYYMDQVIELKLFLEDLAANDEDPGKWCEVEEYEDLFSKITEFSEYISTEELNNTMDWLNEKIAFQKKWEDQYYR